MFSKKVLLVGAMSFLLAACEGGDVNVNANDNSVNTDNSVTNPGGGGGPATCAAITDDEGNVIAEGTFDGISCSYDADFGSPTNPITADLTFPAGIHRMSGTLWIGENVTSGAAPQEGEGPTLTLTEGTTLAFANPTDILVISRGSQIIANGTATNPITLTAQSVLDGIEADNKTQEWGGLVMNGNGITNACSQAEIDGNNCHVEAEGGVAGNYGGGNNAESSGTLRFVIVRNGGFEVITDQEVNGFTLNGVGSGTVIENIQAYSNFDDGIEFFGGAASVRNFVAINVWDDSIDFASGWRGTITNALIVHSEANGNRCIEADNQGGSGNWDAEPFTYGTINNMTCITNSGVDGARGSGEGPLLRRGTMAKIQNSIITDVWARRTAGITSDGECYEMDSAQVSARAEAAAPTDPDGAQTTLNSVVVSCSEALKETDTVWTLHTDINDWFANGAANSDQFVYAGAQSDSPNLSFLNGIYTAEAFTDDLGNPVAVTPVAVDGGATDGNENPIIGAVSASSDWTAGWVVGLDSLYFDPATGL
jgi:hypothetical protein